MIQRLSSRVLFGTLVLLPSLIPATAASAEDVDLLTVAEWRLLKPKLQRGDKRPTIVLAQRIKQKTKQPNSGRRKENKIGNASNDKIDWNKARQLRRKKLQGGTLTKEEEAYLDRAIKLRRKRMPPLGFDGRRGKNRREPKASTGLIPLTDMAGKARYKGQQGGLYGDGKNNPPKVHLAAALREARRIRPLDVAGKPSKKGKIVLISNGMSNTTQEFRAFMRRAADDPQKSPSVVIVDGAQGGMEASDWAHPEKRSRKNRPNPWDVLDRRLKQADVTAKQVQVVWIKQARRNPASLGEFPRHAETLKDDLVVVLQKLKKRFPNLRLAYLSSRIYAGYATTPLNPEPYAYESAFAVRWLIQGQIEGKSGLNYGSRKRKGKAPLVLWGPYLWADGTKGRKTDDLIWKRDDLAGDGTHPSQSGRRKVAELLLKFFKTDPTAKLWFLKTEMTENKQSLVPLPSKAPAPKANPTTAGKVALGKQLFFDPRLSGDNTMSCATCHLPGKAFGDGRSRAKGHKGKELTHNTPTLLNIGFYDNFRWDGGAKSLEQQALGPIQSKDEMNQDLQELEKELNAVPGYVRQFQNVFGTRVTRNGVAKALAAFQRTLVTKPSPFDRYLAGEKEALSKEAKRGLELFTGAAGCVRCHRGPLLSDGKFYRLGVSFNDKGRAAVTGERTDIAKFRTPSLRNIAQTGPYMHDGSLKTLDDVVTFYYRGVPTSTVNGLELDVAPLLENSFSDISAIVAFLKSLTGKAPEIKPPKLP